MGVVDAEKDVGKTETFGELEGGGDGLQDGGAVGLVGGGQRLRQTDLVVVGVEEDGVGGGGGGAFGGGGGGGVGAGGAEERGGVELGGGSAVIAVGAVINHRGRGARQERERVGILGGRR